MSTEVEELIIKYFEELLKELDPSAISEKINEYKGKKGDQT